MLRVRETLTVDDTYISRRRVAGTRDMIPKQQLSIGKHENQLLRAKLAYKHQTGLNLHLSSQFFDTDQAMLIDCSVLINP